MVLRIPFVVLSIKYDLMKKNEPSTSYFMMTLKNNIGHPYFEQQLECIVTLDNIINSNSFDSKVKDIAKKFKSLPKQEGNNKEWLNEMIRLRGAVINAIQCNAKAYIHFLPSFAIK